ncbi:MAG TPA: energy-coupling factor transporter transmembrane component T [Flexilinea sp.]|nr:MAG: Energy-coupling factor transporter transmembrane protein EcfT [Chloroflexi bacterium ADurb.Bin344]HNY93827.1 energy-coupling factor transporter transmembrane component T [Flexilinea sp.]HOG22472.1 energy-coupling factor transporter transmembrane component T [Flexilinea sp.]HOG59854.1 energy-coupling factor transporter transmembrane component T [Flexilinea sp.]HOR56503.1 energy-coupling factor transporter transmembrane component T [Flexilinea sp.]
MASVKMLSYIKRDSPIHRLCGVTKLYTFLVWTIVCMLSYDTRVLLVVMALSIIIFYLAKIKLEEVRFVLLFILFFLLLNNITIYLFSPEEGVKIYGTRHVLFQFTNRYTVTKEQLFYLFNVTLKYFTVVPIALLFIVTTDPSEFASSLSRIGISYRISYAVSITLRYIADIQSDYHNISQSQQARGVDLSKNVPLRKRIAGISSIAVPLIFSSLDRIELISNAMDLRGFGKKEKRTWYCARPFQRIDTIVITGVTLFGLAALIVTFHDGTRFYNPFI